MKRTLLSLSLVGLFLGCSLEAQTLNSGRTQPYQATPTKYTSLKHTLLKVSFDYAKMELNGEATLTASPYFYPSDSLVLDAQAMAIHEVALEKGSSKSPLKYTYANDLLKIQLDKTYAKDENYKVYIKYTARPEQVTQKGSAAITDAKGLYFINPSGEDKEKPTQVWTQGETQSSSVWFPTIDRPNQKTTQEIYMTVPRKYVTLSNGELKSSKNVGEDLRTDYWVMDKPHAPYLFFMGVGDYAVVKDKWRQIPVDYYVEKEYEPYAKQIFGNTPEMIEFFSKRLNYDYPWNKYAQMSARDYVSGAMENTTAVLHAEDVQQKPSQLVDENTWEDTIAHELFHHWFGDLVTMESWSNLTLNESFANYSQYLWNEHKYGKDIADYGLYKELQSYFLDPSNISKDLVRYNYHNREDMFDAVSYNKGGGILHMLRNYLGDEAFFGGLNYYLTTHAYGTAEAADLRLAFEKVSGKDLHWFFNQWYFSGGHPKISYTTRYEPVKKEIVLSIAQTQGGGYFEFPLAVDIVEDSKAKREKIWVSAKAKNEFSIPVSKNPKLVNLNADGVLLAEITESKTPAQYLLQYQSAKEFLPKQRAIANAALNPTDVSAIQTLKEALNDSNFRLRIEALNGLDLSKPDHQKAALTKVEQLASSDEKTLVRGAAINALSKTKSDKYLSLYEKGVFEVSNSIKGNSIGALAMINPQKAKEKLETMQLEDLSSEIMTVLIPIIVENKIEKHRAEIASTAAFYPFIKFQDPKAGAAAEKGYEWIMSSDDYLATQRITKIFSQVHGQLSSNPQAKMLLTQTIQKGLDLKIAALRKEPSNKSLNAQVDLLTAALKVYK